MASPTQEVAAAVSVRIQNPISRPASIQEIETPAMVVDMDALEHNIQTMASSFETTSTVIRPHVKNHKCPELAKLQIAAGAKGVTCATVSEAEGMYRGGISDILIANEVVGPAKIAHLIRIAADGADIKVAVDSEINARALSAAASEAGTEIGILVDLDVGLNRCGVEPGQKAVDLARTISTLPGLRLLGVMAFDGHAGLEKTKAAQQAACRISMQMAVDTKRMIEAAGIPCPVISASSSKTYDTAFEFPELTEIQAGMYLFMDTTYQSRYPDAPFRQALFVLSTVISRRGSRAVADAGIKAVTGFRGPAAVRDREDCKIVSLSAEHSSLDLTADSDLAIGDLLWLAPSWGDGLSALHDRIHAVRGETVEHIWAIDG